MDSTETVTTIYKAFVNLKYVRKIRHAETQQEEETQTDPQHQRQKLASNAERLRIVKLKCEDVTLVEFMYLVFARMPGESYHVKSIQVVYFRNPSGGT